MAKIHVTPEAKRDLQHIKEYITLELDSLATAINTVFKITKSIRRIKDFPALGAPLSGIVDIPNDYRFLVCGNYLVFYRQEGDNVNVIRVIYSRRDYTKILFGITSDSNSEQDE